MEVLGIGTPSRLCTSSVNRLDGVFHERTSLFLQNDLNPGDNHLWVGVRGYCPSDIFGAWVRVVKFVKTDDRNQIEFGRYDGIQRISRYGEERADVGGWAFLDLENYGLKEGLKWP